MVVLTSFERSAAGKDSKDSLHVIDNRAPPDDRAEQSSRAGYPNIDVVLRGKTLMSSYDTLPYKFTLPPLEWVRKVFHGTWLKHKNNAVSR